MQALYLWLNVKLLKKICAVEGFFSSSDDKTDIWIDYAVNEQANSVSNQSELEEKRVTGENVYPVASAGKRATGGKRGETCNWWRARENV